MCMTSFKKKKKKIYSYIVRACAALRKENKGLTKENCVLRHAKYV